MFTVLAALAALSFSASGYSMKISQGLTVRGNCGSHVRTRCAGRRIADDRHAPRDDDDDLCHRPGPRGCHRISFGRGVPERRHLAGQARRDRPDRRRHLPAEGPYVVDADRVALCLRARLDSVPTERYLGCKQKLRCAVNDRLRIEPDPLDSIVGRADPGSALSDGSLPIIYPASSGTSWTRTQSISPPGTFHTHSP